MNTMAVVVGKMNSNRKAIWLWLLVGATLALSLFAVLWQRSLDRQLFDAVQRRESVPTVRSLVRKGANPDARAGGYDPVLFWAAAVGPPETVRLLLDVGASLEPVSEAKITPMFAVATSEHLSDRERRAIVQLLLKKGASLEEQDVLGCTPLMRAVWAGNVAGARVLLDMGADARAVNKQGQSVLFWAGRIPDVEQEMVRMLRGHGAT